jgi:ketosteroid isomerase-like protein
MSQENVELARAALAAFVEVDEGLVDPQQLQKFFAPDAITTFSGFLFDQTTLRGANEFLKWRAAWMEPYADWRYEPEKILDAGPNRVVVTLHQRGKLADSGSWIDMHYGLVYTLEQGLINESTSTRAPMTPSTPPDCGARRVAAERRDRPQVDPRNGTGAASEQ